MISEERFTIPSFVEFWPTAMSIREAYKFSAKLNDADLLAENKKIYVDYKKYIFAHQDAIMAREELPEEALAFVASLIEKAPSTPASRAAVIYQALRDSWLIDLYNEIAMYINETTEEA